MTCRGGAGKEVMTESIGGTAEAWIGRSVVDRDGLKIGACSAVVADVGGDPAWIGVENGGVTRFLPAADAVESSGQLRVGVRREQVLAAPATAMPGAVSSGEEQVLRRHYGPAQSTTRSSHAGPQATSRLLQLIPGAAVVAALVWAVARLRRRRQPTSSERLAEASRAASAALAHRAKELASSAAPAAETTGHLALRGAHAGTHLAGRAAAAAAPVVATATGVAAREGRRAASQAGSGVVELASTAGELAARAADTGQRLGGTVAETLADVPEVVADRVDDLQRTWSKTMNRLTFCVSLAVGYVLGARAGRQRYDQISRTASRLAARPEVQQAQEKLRTAAGLEQDTAGSQGSTL
jgi:hypothetical protein